MSGRGDAMVARRRLDSQLKHQRVIAAVDAHLAAGQDLSVAALARHAGVSRKFIYAHPDLRARIEQRAEQATRAGTSQSGRGRARHDRLAARRRGQRQSAERTPARAGARA